VAFNFEMLFILFKRSFTGTRNTDARLTLRRLIVLFILIFIYPLFFLYHAIFYLLDEIFLFFYRKVIIEEPVFILGVPRSGTTYLHRLMAKDTDRFTCMKTWEVIFAHSIIQKYFFVALGKIDKTLGQPFYRLIVFIQSKLVSEKAQQFHTFDLFLPEEDEPILIGIFSSAFLAFIFPFDDVFRPYIHFDDEISEKRRAKIMSFYKRSVQRHLFVFGKNKQYLSKNPAFSPKVESLKETFPDCHIICTTRNPQEVVPSVFSLFRHVLPTFISPVSSTPLRSYLLDLLAHWYRYPPERLKTWPKQAQDVVRYNDLIKKPDQIVLRLYKRFGFDATERFKETLKKEKVVAAKYKSKHKYSLDEFGFSEKEIYSEFRDVFTAYKFDKSLKAS